MHSPTNHSIPNFATAPRNPQHFPSDRSPAASPPPYRLPLSTPSSVSPQVRSLGQSPRLFRTAIQNTQPRPSSTPYPVRYRHGPHKARPAYTPPTPLARSYAQDLRKQHQREENAKKLKAELQQKKEEAEQLKAKLEQEKKEEAERLQQEEKEAAERLQAKLQQEEEEAAERLKAQLQQEEEEAKLLEAKQQLERETTQNLLQMAIHSTDVTLSNCHHYLPANPKGPCILVFDVETVGPRHDHATIAIGACIVDAQLQRCSSFLSCAYPGPVECPFDPNCLEKFWHYHQKTLEKIRVHTLKHNPPLPEPNPHGGESAAWQGVQAQQARMIKRFLQWVAKCQEWADRCGVDMLVGTDNEIFDGGCVDRLINKYLPERRLIAYNAYTGTYQTMVQVRERAIGGVLALLYSELTANCRDMLLGCERRCNPFYILRQYYDIPLCPCRKDHMPQNDAYVIAHNYQCLIKTLAGAYSRRPTLSPNFT